MDRPTENARPPRAFIDNRDHGAGRRIPQTTASVVAIVCGKRGGFHLQSIRTFLTADELNAADGVTEAQRETIFSAWLHRSLFRRGVATAQNAGRAHIICTSPPCKAFSGVLPHGQED